MTGFIVYHESGWEMGVPNEIVKYSELLLYFKETGSTRIEVPVWATMSDVEDAFQALTLLVKITHDIQIYEYVGKSGSNDYLNSLRETIQKNIEKLGKISEYNPMYMWMCPIEHSTICLNLLTSF